MSKHTPGPWEAVIGDYGHIPLNSYLAIYGNGGSCAVAYVLVLKQSWEPGKDREHPVEANARLIAAAPDLLDTLLAMREAVYDPIGCWSHAIEAAIAKATGED